MGWTKHGSIVFGPSQPWELDATQEIDIIPDPTGVGDWRAFYMGGWIGAAIGTATSNDGITWTKLATNPVLGLGKGGISHSAGHFSITRHPTDPLTLYCFFTDPDAGPPVSAPTDLFRATSTDGGLTWGSVVTALDHAGWETGRWGNSNVHIDDDGTWHMLYEAMDGSSVWQMGYATSPDGLVWTRQNGGNPISSLRYGTGMYGGPDLHVLDDGTFEVFYHASTSGVLPTRIYRATSADLINWTKDPSTPLLEASLSFEVDQVADPHVITLGDGTRRLYYSGVDNPNERSRLTFATEVEVINVSDGLPPLPRDGRVAIWYYQGESSSRAGLNLVEPDSYLILPTSDDYPGRRTDLGVYPEGTVFVFEAFPDDGSTAVRSDDPRQVVITGSWTDGFTIAWETIAFGRPDYNPPDYNDQILVVSLVSGGWTVGAVGIG